MFETYTNLFQSFTGFTIHDLVKAIILILIGYIIAKVSTIGANRTFLRLTPNYQSKLLNSIIFYIVFILFCMTALQHLGFKLNILLGAAGILTVALGFASQTSVSNIISGLFLLGEKPFKVGDTIQVDSIGGEVISIDLLSVKIRTDQNTYLRVPNEYLIKSNITNVTRFPIRRFDLNIGVAYNTDLEKVKTILFKIAEENMLCLEEPKPKFVISGFGNSAINLQFCIWASQKNFDQLKNTIQQQVKIAFEQNKINMPFPQLTISTETPLSLELPQSYGQKNN